MDVDLRCRFWRIDQKIDEFLKATWVACACCSDFSSLLLLLVAIFIQYFIDPQAGVSG
jgi:hypothetical protein